MSLWGDQPPPPQFPPAVPYGPPPPTRRKRGPIRIVAGILLILGGFAAIASGIVFAVGERDRIETEAVARGPAGTPLRFQALEPDYTIFALLPGASGDSDRADSLVARTECTARSTFGITRMLGSSQGFSIKLGSAASIGRFNAPGGEIEVVCDGPGAAEYVVSPGRPSVWQPIVVIIAGAFAILLGIGLVIWGAIGRRVPA